MRTYEITVRVTHDVAFELEAMNEDEAKYEAQRRASALWDNVIDTPVVEVVILDEEAK